MLASSAVSTSRPSGPTEKMKPSAQAPGAEQTPVPKAMATAKALSVIRDQNRTSPGCVDAPRRSVALASALFERNADALATHLGEEADKADDGFELAHLEIAAAGDKHLVCTPVFRDGAHNPSTVPAVMALLACLLADHLEEVAVGQEAAQTVFSNHIRGFFYHGLPLGPFPA